jgi:hypothetical protein
MMNSYLTTVPNTDDDDGSEAIELEEEPTNVSGQLTQPNDTVTHHFNSTNAKKIAFAMVLGFILYHGILRVNFSEFLFYLFSILRIFNINSSYYALIQLQFQALILVNGC